MHLSHTMFDTRVLSASVEFLNQKFIKPLVLSSGPITEITEARVAVRVRVGEAEAVGRGSIYLSDLWAWPDATRTHAERDAALRRLCEEIARNLWQLCGGEAMHPLELGLRLHHGVCAQPEIAGTPPVLARAMCASPFDAAIHDGVGVATGRSAFALYREPAVIPAADQYFPDLGAVRAIGAMLRPEPVRELQAWLIVGKNDTRADLEPWVRGCGYGAFKLKLMGQQNDVDVARTIEVFQIVRSLNVAHPRLRSLTDDCWALPASA